MSQSGASPHGRNRKNQGQGGYGNRAGNPGSSNKSGGNKFGNKAGGKGPMNGSAGSSGSNEGVRISRTPHSYTSAVAGYNSKMAPNEQLDSEYGQRATEGGPSERTHYIAMNLIGQQVRAVLKDGTVYEGLFHNPIFDRGFGVVLYMARKKENNDTGVIRTPPIEQITIQPQDLVLLDAPEVAFIEDTAEFKKKMMREAGFRTDTEISNRDFSERELVPWMPADDEDSLGGLEDDKSSARNRWDQFEANERLFGVRTTFDESSYTTEIDRQRVTREVVEKAIRIERELLYQTTNNPHLAEERGIVAPKDDTEDEEDKYSSVLRDQKTPAGAKGSVYVVPAKRKHGGKDDDAKEDKKKDEREKTRSSEFQKLHQREQEIEREREREREKEKEREKARQKERERLDRERAANKAAPDSPSAGLRSRSTTSIGKLAEQALGGEGTTGGMPSPLATRSTEVPTLTTSPFRQRSYSMSNLHAAGAPGSPYANLDPDDPHYIEKLRVRQKLLAEARNQTEPRAAPQKLQSPFHSPIVGRPEQIKSLDLSPAVPRVSEAVLHEFKEYKERKRSLSNSGSSLPTKTDLANFSKEIEKKASAPNSPALRARRTEYQPSPLSPRHVLDATAAKLEQEKEKKAEEKPASTTPGTASSSASNSAGTSAGPASVTSTPFTTPAVVTPPNESPASSAASSSAASPRGKTETSSVLAAATAAQTASGAAPEAKPAAGGDATTATDGGQPPLSKIQLPSLKSKLNPFAKAFTPKARPAGASAAAPAADKSGPSPPGSVGKPTVDINIPVSSYFAQGMRRLQENPEDPEQVAPVWPYGRAPYRQDEAGMPMEGFPYPPVPTMSPIPPQGPRPMGFPVPYVTSPPPAMGSGQPVMMFPPGQPVPRGFVPQGSIPAGPGVPYYPGGPAGQPYPPHMYAAPPPGTVPGPAPGPMGHKGRMGPYPPHIPPPLSPHAPPHSPQGTPPRSGPPSGGVPTTPPGAQPIPLAGGPPPQGFAGQFPPGSPPAFAVPPEHGAPPHSPHTQTASPHSPHAARAQPHMVPVSPTQPIYSFPPAPHILGDPLAVQPGRGPHQQIPQQQMVVPGMAGRGGYRYMQQGQGPQGPPQMGRGEFVARSEGGAPPAKSPAQSQPYRQGNPSVSAGAFYPGQGQRSNQPRGGGQQSQDKEGGQRFKVPNTDVLPQQ